MKLKTELVYINSFPSPKDVALNPFLIFDRRLLKNAQTAKWLKKFPHIYPVDAGEDLKQLESFEKHLNKILGMLENISEKKITFVAVGGGSVGDFVGFLASVFKRGTPLIQIPSTWLAAIDSAHGGKTALNAGGHKNQIGTFYCAQKVILCRSLLFTQPPDRVSEAMGEIIKTLLLCGGNLWTSLSEVSNFSHKTLWKFLPEFVEYKYKVVQKDPLEKKGHRFILNLGHTFGHAFESALKLPHGVAVNKGLLMAIEFSKEKNILSRKQEQRIQQSTFISKFLANKDQVKKDLSKIKSISKYLQQDKKVDRNGTLNYVFIESVGRPKVVRIPLKELAAFAKSFAK